MRNWNLILTAVPGPQHVHDLLSELRRSGHFATSAFKDVILGEVTELSAFLERLREAREKGERWATLVGRVIPIEQRFRFTPQTLAPQLCEIAAGLLERMPGRSFHVRLERRGHAGELRSPDVERAVADHLFAYAQAHGIALRTDFQDPDFVVVAETVGDECGVGLITREVRTRFPFVHTR